MFAVVVMLDTCNYDVNTENTVAMLRLYCG